MDILEIAKIIKSNGGKLYLVGGAIRDEILKRENHDKDYCVTKISKEKFLELFPNAKIQGKAFEVFTIENKEIALARIEKKVSTGHSGFEIETNEQITIEQDLARRDITINSIAKDVLTNEIIDPFNGLQDIKNKIIRATTNAFKEDPLRVYRVARFASTLEFTVEEETIKLMNSLKNELNTLPKERVFEEFKKAISSQKPSIFFETLKKANVLDVHFKEIYNLIGAMQPNKYHPEGDAYNHTMIVLDKSAELTNKLEIRFSALVHDIGKSITPKQEYPHHYNHDKNGPKLVYEMSNRIGIPKLWTSCGKVAAKEHMKGGIFEKMTPAKKVQFIERIAKTKLGLEGLQIVVNADKSIRETNTQKLEFKAIGKECLEAINGKYIKEKYNIQEGIEVAYKLHEERVKWMKEKSIY